MTDNEARAALAARWEDIGANNGETWCPECRQVRTIPCRYALCPLQARAATPLPSVAWGKCRAPLPSIAWPRG